MKDLEEWVLKFTSESNEYGKQQRVANTRSVVDAVYSGDNTYKFGCAFIRSLHGEKKPGSKEYERVACAGDMCHCIKKNAEEEENAKLLHLAETGNADLTGKLVKTRVMVAGKSIHLISFRKTLSTIAGVEKVVKGTLPSIRYSYAYWL